MKSRKFIAGSFTIILSLSLCLSACVSIKPKSPSVEVAATSTPSATPDAALPDRGPGGAGTVGDVFDDPPEESPQPSDTPKIVNIQKNWHIFGEGKKSYETPGMPGESNMIIKLDVSKQGGATPAGTYTGSFSIWYNEMTPALMKQYGITGDSHNEYQTDSFTVEVIPWTHNKDWPYQATRVTQSIVITSITDVTVKGHKQKVTDYPDAKLGYSVDINPDTGKVRFIMTLGMLESFIYDDFKLESSGM